MAEISAAAVKSLREKTGLPMMECKKALAASNGNEDAAIRWLREQGIKTQETRLGRETGAGRLAVYLDPARKVGAMVEVQCESAPVAGSPDFKQFAKRRIVVGIDGRGDGSFDAMIAWNILRIGEQHGTAPVSVMFRFHGKPAVPTF